MNFNLLRPVVFTDDVTNKSLTGYPWCEIEVHGVTTDHMYIIDCRNTRT